MRPTKAYIVQLCVVFYHNKSFNISPFVGFLIELHDLKFIDKNDILSFWKSTCCVKIITRLTETTDWNKGNRYTLIYWKVTYLMI